MTEPTGAETPAPEATTADRPCLCGGDACLGQETLCAGWVCVREAGLKAETPAPTAEGPRLADVLEAEALMSGLNPCPCDTCVLLSSQAEEIATLKRERDELSAQVATLKKIVGMR